VFAYNFHGLLPAKNVQAGSDEFHQTHHVEGGSNSGRPRVQAEIHHNRFYHSGPDKAAAQSNAAGNMLVHDNQFTPDGALKK